MKDSKRIIISILAVAAAALVAWQFRHNPEWKHFTWAAVWSATSRARGRYMAAAIVLIYASYLIRAVRWQGLMFPQGRFWPVMSGTAIGFTALSLLGRAGELVRPYYIARRSNQNFSPQLAVLVIERIFDMAGVVLIVGLDIAFDPNLHGLTGGPYQAALQRGGMIVAAFTLALLALLYLFHFRSGRILQALRRRHQLRPHPLRHRLLHFLEMLAEGTSSLTRPASLTATLTLTVLLWLDVSATVWFVIRAYPGLLPGFSFFGAMLLMGLTAIGAVVQLPAVGGGFQVITIFALTHIFGADLAAATSAALILWLICFYAIAPSGLALAAHQGFSWRGLEREAIAAEVADEAAAEVTDEAAEL